MKPSSQQNHSQRSDRRTFPLVDCQYQTTIEAARSSAQGMRAPDPMRPLWKLSNDFLGAESSNAYIGELVAFIVIGSLSAWSIIFALHSITRMLGNY